MSFTSLSPFYSAYMREVNQQVGFTIWRQATVLYAAKQQLWPGIEAKMAGSGVLALPCRMGLLAWNVPTVAMRSKSAFFCVVGDKAHQVHVCEKCKLYLKTVDRKVLEKTFHWKSKH